MAPDPLSSSWAKYYWAKKHMQSVQTAVDKALDPEVYGVSLKMEIEQVGNTAIAIVKVASLPAVRADCGLAIGDVFQNFRAALDHLAWALVQIGADPKPKKPQRVYFPVAKTGKSFHGQIDEWLPGVSADDRAFIRRYQPYRRGDGPKAIRWLRNHSDTDKHRILVPTLVNHASVHLTVTTNWRIVEYTELLKRPCALYVGAPVLHLKLRRASLTDCQVNVDGKIALYPSLGRGVPLWGALGAIQETVLEILTEFDGRI